MLEREESEEHLSKFQTENTEIQLIVGSVVKALLIEHASELYEILIEGNNRKKHNEQKNKGFHKKSDSNSSFFQEFCNRPVTWIRSAQERRNSNSIAFLQKKRK